MLIRVGSESGDGMSKKDAERRLRARLAVAEKSKTEHKKAEEERKRSMLLRGIFDDLEDHEAEPPVPE